MTQTFHSLQLCCGFQLTIWHQKTVVGHPMITGRLIVVPATIPDQPQQPPQGHSSLIRAQSQRLAHDCRSYTATVLRRWAPFAIIPTIDVTIATDTDHCYCWNRHQQPLSCFPIVTDNHCYYQNRLSLMLSLLLTCLPMCTQLPCCRCQIVLPPLLCSSMTEPLEHQNWTRSWSDRSILT